MTSPPTKDTAEERNASINWSEVLAAHEGWLRKVIAARTGEPQAVDDVFQQLALAACCRGDQLRDCSRIVPWLHRIAVVLSARHRRSMGRTRAAMAGLANRLVTDVETTRLDVLIDQERHEATRVAMSQLQPRDREVLILKYDEHMSYRAIAIRLGITEKAIDRRLSRARDKLRHELNRAGMNTLGNQ